MKGLKIAALIFIILLAACQKERYRQNKTHKMTKKAKLANRYLATQSEKLTQKNIENKPENAKKSQKRNEKIQKDLNELNTKTSKVKKPKKHSGEFKLY